MKTALPVVEQAAATLPGPHWVRQGRRARLGRWLERVSPAVFLMPALLLLLFLSVFPLLVSLYLSVTRFKFVRNGFELNYVGLLNFRKLLDGSNRERFLGQFGEVNWLGWLIIAAAAAVILRLLLRAAGRTTWLGLLGRLIAAAAILALIVLAVLVFSPAGIPGTLVNTLVYVAIGVSAQYLVGLGLALLCMQNLPGRRFFRALFFLPLMITPVGIAYMARMLADTSKGPFAPVWNALGLEDFAWSTDPAAARLVVMLGDAWQWIPFMFIVLSAALESQPADTREAAQIDGASPWQTFRYITVPAILPLSVTLILIRTIEAFKIVDLPNVLTNGGPGIASESLVLNAYIFWRALDFGGSAAISYLMLVVVVILCMTIGLVGRRPAPRAIR